MSQIVFAGSAFIIICKSLFAILLAKSNTNMAVYTNVMDMKKKLKRSKVIEK